MTFLVPHSLSVAGLVLNPVSFWPGACPFHLQRPEGKTKGRLREGGFPVMSPHGLVGSVSRNMAFFWSLLQVCVAGGLHCRGSGDGQGGRGSGWGL